MWPRPRSRIRGATASAQLTGPQSMVPTASSKWERSRAANGPTWMMPATVSRVSMGPSRASMRLTIALTAALSATSQTSVCTSAPPRRRSAAACSSASASRELITTRWPRSPSSRAMRSPRPREPPATRASGARCVVELSGTSAPLITPPVCGRAAKGATEGPCSSLSAADVERGRLAYGEMTDPDAKEFSPMRALTWQGKETVSVETVPDPVISQPTDAVIKVTSTAICGSDLHLYSVLGPYLHQGDILGHEPMGIVEEVGSEVTHIKPGDRVVVPFNISCGSCWMCTRGLFAQCETTQNREQGTGASLFA